MDFLESLETTLSRIRDALKQSQKQFIIFVDDIDRLSPKDLQHMLALIKSLGNLPKLTYVLAYDQQEVLRLLELAYMGDARYLEKIVQASFGMPKIDRYALRSLLFAKLDAILAGFEIDPKRWSEAYFFHIDGYLQTPRHVNRLVNSLRVTWPAVKGEVDWTDLVTLEVLRLHEPRLFALVQEKLDLLTGEDQLSGLNKEWQKDLRPTPGNAAQPDLANKALAYLFPRLAKDWDTFGGGHSDANEDRRNRRLRSPDYARNYFFLSPSPDQFPSSQIRTLLRGENVEAGLQDILEKAATVKTRKALTMVSRLLEQIAEEVSAAHPLLPAFGRTLAKLSATVTEVHDVEQMLFAVDNEQRLRWVFIAGLRALKLEERAACFLEWLPGVEGITFTLPLGEMLTSEDARKSSEVILDPADFAHVREELQKLVNAAAEKGEWLLTQPNLTRFLFAWVRLSGAEVVAGYLKAHLGSDTAIIHLVDAMPGEVRSTHEGIYFVVDKEAWNTLLPMDVFEKRVAEVKSLTPADSPAAEIFAKFETAMKRGSPWRGIEAA